MSQKRKILNPGERGASLGMFVAFVDLNADVLCHRDASIVVSQPGSEKGK